MTTALLVAALLLAFVNGANDNLKGVATLYGAGRVGYRGALALATVSTAAGALASVVIASGLVRAFSGKGLVPPEVLAPDFLTAVAAAAALTVLIATRIGMPISTTHAIVGGLLGAGAVLAGSALDLAALGSAFALPLLVGPLLAVALAWTIARGGGAVGRGLGLDASSCICVVPEVSVASGGVALESAAFAVQVAHRDDCGARHSDGVRGFDVARAIDAGHWLSASAVGFARGLNDTPKILGLLVGAAVVTPLTGALAIASAMSIGGIVAARRVTVTMAHRITPMSPAHALAGNLSTSLLVIGASNFGVPVSTTHVSTGGIFGIGATAGTLRGNVARGIMAAWVTTVPVAALLGAAFAWGLS